MDSANGMSQRSKCDNYGIAQKHSEWTEDQLKQANADWTVKQTDSPFLFFCFYRNYFICPKEKKIARNAIQKLFFLLIIYSIFIDFLFQNHYSSEICF